MKSSKYTYTSLWLLLVLILSVMYVSIVLSMPACEVFIDRGVTDDDIQTILDKHNSLRSLITQGEVPGQPRGTNLKEIKWDDPLAQKAQEIADTCVFEHERVVDPRWDYSVGQNLGWAWGYPNRDKDWNSKIVAWFNDKENFIYPNISLGMSGHYVQLVWSDTEYVGCGYTKYKQFRKSYEGEGLLYVCNYGPGAFVDEAPYVAVGWTVD